MQRARIVPREPYGELMLATSNTRRLARQLGLG